MPLEVDIYFHPNQTFSYLFKQEKGGKMLDEKYINRIIEMAWEDRTPFEAIYFQFRVSESEVISIMRQNLKRASFNLWRKRVNSGVSQKHLRKRNPNIDRFRSTLQKSITHNKISKR